MTADPVGGVQVRRRIKMYKALLGPRVGRVWRSCGIVGNESVGTNGWSEHGCGFRFYVGHRRRARDKICLAGSGAEIQAGGADPGEGRTLEEVDRPVQREDALEGEFRDLYTYGYDVPEAMPSRKTGRCTTPSLRTRESRSGERSSCAG